MLDVPSQVTSQALFASTSVFLAVMEQIPSLHAHGGAKRQLTVRQLDVKSKWRIARNEGMAKILRPRCLLWVETGKAQCENMFSALALKADIAQQSRHVRFVP